MKTFMMWTCLEMNVMIQTFHCDSSSRSNDGSSQQQWLFFSVSTVQKLNFDSINGLCIFYVIYFIRCANQCAHIVSLVISNLEATSCRNAFSSSCKLCIIFLLVFALFFLLSSLVLSFYSINRFENHIEAYSTLLESVTPFRQGIKLIIRVTHVLKNRIEFFFAFMLSLTAERDPRIFIFLLRFILQWICCSIRNYKIILSLSQWTALVHNMKIIVSEHKNKIYYTELQCNTMVD